jgi:hypothetical protein
VSAHTKRKSIVRIVNCLSRRQNLQYTLSLDPNFAPFLIDGVTWLRKTTTAPLRGFENDADTVPEALDSHLDKINFANDAKVLRAAFQQSLEPPQSSSRRQTPTALPRTSKTPTKNCPLCKQAG